MLDLEHGSSVLKRFRVAETSGSPYRNVYRGFVMSEIAADLFNILDEIAAAPSASEVWKAYLSAAQRVGLCYGFACYPPVVKTDQFRIVAASCPEG